MQRKWKFSEIWMIFTEKSAFHAENRDLWKITKKCNNSLPDSLIWLIFGWKFAIYRWKMKISRFWHKNLFYWLQGPTYPKMSQIGLSGDELLRFSWFFTNHDFQHGRLIFQWKSSIYRRIFTFFTFSPIIFKSIH